MYTTKSLSAAMVAHLDYVNGVFDLSFSASMDVESLASICVWIVIAIVAKRKP